VGHAFGGGLFVRSDFVGSLSGHYRAYGIPVRCVQHLPTAFSPFLRVAAGGEPGFFGRPDCATARKPV